MAIYNNRVCKQCGVTFSGGPRAWYCPKCRIERTREKDRLHKRNGTERPLGSIDICKNCGKEYIVNSGLQKYCPECKDEMYKKLDNEQGTEYYHNKLDKGKRNERRRKHYDKHKDEINEKRRQKYSENKKSPED